MMRTRTDQTIFSPLGLVCILMVYVFCNLSDASNLGGVRLLCALLERVQISLSFFFPSGSDEDVDKYLLMAAGFPIHDEAAQGLSENFPPLAFSSRHKSI